MSRCFRFPPPGYEKKPRTDGVDLLKKEKHRGKRHKKEEDKEKREKREKEGRDGKHKEKKDKKEKHREKKKDKDKDRDKDKSKISTADEKGFPGQAHGPIAVKPHQKEIKQNDKKDVLFEDKLIKQHASNNGEQIKENNHLAENRDSKFLLELDRRIKDNDGEAGNHLVQKFTIADDRKDEGTVRLLAKGSGTLPEVKEKLQDKGINARKIDGRGIWPEIRSVGNATVQNHAGNFHPRVDEMPRPLEKNFYRTLEATVEGKEKVKEKKDNKRGDKRKAKEKEKKGHGKDKDRDKEKKKEKKAKEHTEHKNREQINKLNESNKAGLVGSNSFTQASEHHHENSAVGKNIKKRKDIESNGVLHANDNWPAKMPRPSSHPFTENGRILEPCQISLLNASDRQGAATNVKLDNKERGINGIIETLPSAVFSNKTPTATVPADPKTKASAKPPHPDTKYLSHIYSIPETEVQSDFDDQEWLFGSGCSQERKPVVKSLEAGDTLQVWAEAVHIGPVDIFALPYVIPY